MADDVHCEQPVGTAEGLPLVRGEIEANDAAGLDRGEHVGQVRLGRVHPEADRPVLVLLPTWNLLDSRIWNLLVPLLSQRCTVVTYGPRGAGKSERPPVGYTLDEPCRRRPSGSRRERGRTGAVVGLSTTTNVAVALAARKPERVERLAREGDADGNDKTAGDPAWTSLVPSPPYPDHPSGYNCVTSGFMHAAEAFLGKGKQAFAVTANVGSPPAPVTREYERFTDVIADTIDARIYLGIHFRAPDEQAADIGKDVAHWLDKHYFGPAK